MPDKLNSIRSLAHWLGTGALDAKVVLPAIEQFAGRDAEVQSLLALRDALAAEPDEASQALVPHLDEALRNAALRLQRSRSLRGVFPPADQALLGDLPLDTAKPWNLEAPRATTLQSVMKCARDVVWLAANQERAPQLFRRVKEETSNALTVAHAAIAQQFERYPESALEKLAGAWPEAWPGRSVVLDQIRTQMREARRSLLEKAATAMPAPPDDPTLPDRLAGDFAAAGSDAEKNRLLACASSWVSPAAVPAILAIAADPWAQNRLRLLLTVRFGQPELRSWNDWIRWLTDQTGVWQRAEQAMAELIGQYPAACLLVLYARVPDPDPSVVDALLRQAAALSPPVTAQELAQRYASMLAPSERMILLEIEAPPPVLPPPLPASARVVTPPPLPRVIPRPAPAHRAALPATSQEASMVPPMVEPPMAPPPAAPAPPKPSLWDKHIQPFFVENWYIVAGIAMVIAGSSLLAYYTWDKHWLVRYTIMPALLALFTWSLAGVGLWIERKAAEFKDTSAILHGAAIGLLPINFMALAVLSADEQVPQKGIALLVMAALYLGMFGWGLRRWCARVHPGLGNFLAGTLLFLNFLVAVGPLARTFGRLEGFPLLGWLGAGFYAGFFVMCWAAVHFTRRILTRELVEEKRVPWFVTGVLAGTYLEVFVWVHGFMRHVPHAYTYALLVIFFGWLVLHMERRTLELRGSTQLHGGESFLGFAMILLGLLLGFAEPVIRVATFALAGWAWLRQAHARQHQLHYWISLMLLALAGVSVGLLPQYPARWLPLLGLVLALGFGAGNRWSLAREQADLAAACRGMQVAVAFITAMVAPLVQWHHNHPPLDTAGWLLAVAALFAWRALQDQKIHWLHATMLIVALVLPYAGFVDMAQRTAHHNTMTFGLALVSALWLVVTRLRPTPLILQARSTVLWFYGILALTAMVLRVLLGDAIPNELWYRDFMDYTGPFLMMAVLIPATYYSRSMVPAFMAVAIMAILFPELRANLRLSIPGLSWGSGIGSATWALGLTALCFYLRRWPFLKDLPEGDRFMDREWFPFRRYDHTLFTWPILAAVVFLIIKVDTWNVISALAAHGVQFKTAVALVMTGVTWTLLAVYHREQRGAVMGVHLGWIAALAGIWFGYWRQVPAPHASGPILCFFLLVQALYWIYRHGLEPRFPWVATLLTQPMHAVLQAGSGVVVIISMVGLLAGAAWEHMVWLYLFLGAQLVWHALASRRYLFGTLLFFQIWIGLLAATAPGLDGLFARLSVAQSVTPSLAWFLAIQVGLLALEFAPAVHDRLKPLATPLLILASVFGFCSGLVAGVDGLAGPALSLNQQLLLLTVLVLTARAQGSSLVGLAALLFGYVILHRDVLVALSSADARMELLATPWHLALLSLTMVLLAQGVRWLETRQRAWVAGPYSHPFFCLPAIGCIFWPAAVIAVFAALYHTGSPDLRASAVQLWTPYLGAATLGLIALFWPSAGFCGAAALLLALGNIHLVRIFTGEYFRAHGLSELHLIALGLSVTLVQASAIRRLLRSERGIAAVNRCSLALGGLILTLLSANYFTAPDLASITSMRFLVSGAMAFLAGWYFRRAARHPGPGEEAHVALCEALYHFGLVLAMWCTAWLVPALRQPLFSLMVLVLPVIYFFVRAELGMRAGSAETPRYRNSAAVLGFVVLFLFSFKGIFHLILFPGIPVTTRHYHDHAAVIFLLGLVLLRLHGLGGTSWLAFYGGLSLLFGSYFLVTGLPGLSPFTHPMPGAWCALVIGHFWIVASHARSPLRALLQQLANLDDSAWHSLRRGWGYCLLAATHVATLWAFTDYQSNTYMIAPLLAGVASILLHQGIIRQLAARAEPDATPANPGLPYLLLAVMELAVALHMDFLIPSYLAADDVVWALLGVWLVTLVIDQCREITPRVIGYVALSLGALVLAHALHHHPWSDTGLWAAGLGALLAAWHPQRERSASGGLTRECASGLLWVPAWLVYFSQIPVPHGADLRWADLFAAWPIIATTATVFLIGLLGRLFPAYLSPHYQAWTRSKFRLFDSTIAILEAGGPGIHRVTLWLTLGVAGLVQLLHYQTAFALRELVVLVGLEAGLTVAWYYEARARQSIVAYYLLQISAVAVFVTLRRHVMLTTNQWNYEYDVWISLGFAFALAGANQMLKLQPKAVRVPLLTSMFALPALALVWVVVHGLGVNLALLVVGLQSILFAYLGKDERESPFNIVALSGFVAFVLITFYSKLHLHAVHAYVIPVGLGVLVLLELFRNQLTPETANWTRFITLLAMLGSAGYYALADTRHPITFNLTMIGLCLLAMGMGSLLKIRLHLGLGFVGLIVDLISIVYKMLVLMERSARMTVIGTCVLLLGALVVFGAIYHKANRAKFDALAARWRGRFAAWQ